MCKWFHLCPLRRFEKQGQLDEKWVRDYCRGDYLGCARYQQQEAGRAHPDHLMPDGILDESLI